MSNKIQKQIEAILKKNFVPFKLQDVLLIIAITNKFNRSVQCYLTGWVVDQVVRMLQKEKIKIKML